MVQPSSKTNMKEAINTGKTILLKYERSLLFVLLLLAAASSIVRAAVEPNVCSGDFVFMDP